MKQVFGKSKLENQLDHSLQKQNTYSTQKFQQSSQIKSTLKFHPETIHEEANRKAYKPIDPQFMQLYQNTLILLKESLVDRLPIDEDDVNSDFQIRFKIRDQRKSKFQELDDIINGMISEAPINLVLEQYEEPPIQDEIADSEKEN